MTKQAAQVATDRFSLPAPVTAALVILGCALFAVGVSIINSHLVWAVICIVGASDILGAVLLLRHLRRRG